MPTLAPIVRPSGIEHSLALSLRLIDAADHACAAYAAQLDLPNISVPNIEAPAASEEDRTHLRSVAPLYFASELEQAALLPAVETLSALFATGGFTREVGSAAPRIINFWRNRQSRFSPQERNAIFARLFGAGQTSLASPLPESSNGEFEVLLLSCCEALVANEDSPLWPPQPNPAASVRLQVCVSRLLENLSMRSVGIAPFAARDIINAITAALEIVREPALQRAFGANATWPAVRSIARQLLRQTPSVNEHIARAQSGQILLAWFAEELPNISSLSPIPAQRMAPATTAAAAWMQATLSMTESMRTSQAGAA